MKQWNQSSPILLLAMILAFSLFPAQSPAEERPGNILRQTLDDLFVDSAESQKATPESKEDITLSFAPLVKKTRPSVVNVFTTKIVEVNRSPFAGDPFFERFFGSNSPFSQPRRKERMQNSLGSGVIVSGDGIVLTNYHVIEQADEVKVVLYDGTEYEADIILNDEKSDLAVLKLREAKGLEPLPIADSEEVEVGDLVLAIGNPFGVGQTVTSGIISAVARSRVGINDFDFFLQTDAAINPGNSGGALVDMKGQLIGINTAIYSRSGGSIGIGFAIPSNMASVILRSVEQGSSVVVRPWIGITTQEVTSEIAESLGMRRPSGVLVTAIYEGGPGDDAGLRPGDVIVGVNDRPLMNNDELAYRLATIGIGGRAELIVISDNERRIASLQLIEAPETTPRNETRLHPETVLGGATIANLSPAVAQEIGLPNLNNGVVVLDVQGRSRAFANRVRKGDIIRAINGVEVNRVREVERIVSRRSRRGWQVVLERDGHQLVFERNGRAFRQYRQ